MNWVKRSDEQKEVLVESFLGEEMDQKCFGMGDWENGKDKGGLDFAVIEMSGDGNLWNGD